MAVWRTGSVPVSSVRLGRTQVVAQLMETVVVAPSVRSKAEAVGEEGSPGEERQ